MRIQSKSLPGFYKNLFIIAIPIIIQQLMMTFVNMLDTIMVGQLGSVEIAGVGLGNQIFFMLNMVLFGISSGGSIFIAQYWGKHDIDGIHRVMGIMFSMALATALLFSVGAIFFPAVLIALYSDDAAVIASGAGYLRIVGFSYLFMAVGFVYQFSLRSTEHVRLPMITTVIAFGVNVVCNYLLIFGASVGPADGPWLVIPHMGVRGAALATIISRAVELIILVGYAYAHGYETAAPIRRYVAFNRFHVFRFCKVSLPVILNETLWGAGVTIENSIFSHMGTASIAAFNIISTVSQLTWVFFIGVGNAAAILIGKRIGASKIEESRAYANRFAWFMPCAAVFFALLLIPLANLLPRLFKVEPEILDMAKAMLLTLMCSYPFNAFNMCMIVGVCRSGGDTRFAAVIDLVWMWGIAIPLGAFAAFVLGWQAWQVYACLLVEQVLKTICGIVRLRSGKWLHTVSI